MNLSPSAPFAYHEMPLMSFSFFRPVPLLSSFSKFHRDLTRNPRPLRSSAMASISTVSTEKGSISTEQPQDQATPPPVQVYLPPSPWLF